VGQLPDFPPLVAGLPSPRVSYNPYTTPMNRYMHMHNGLTCKVQGLHNTASAIAHSHCLAFVYISLHRAKRTHRRSDFQKRCSCWQFSLKI